MDIDKNENGHHFVRIGYWPQKPAPLYKGRNLRPTAICAYCGLVHWRSSKQGHFGPEKGENGREIYHPPKRCGDAYYPLGAVPQFFNGKIYSGLGDCTGEARIDIKDTLASIKAMDERLDAVASQQRALEEEYEAHWGTLNGLASLLVSPMQPAIAKSTRSASAKDAARAKRRRVAK